MANYLRLRNFDRDFSKLVEPPVFVNELANGSEENREMLRSMIMTRYSGDMISLLPSCRCGLTKSESSVNRRCLTCGTVVESAIENDIQSALWFKRPVGVAKLLNPTVWHWLDDRTTTSGFSVMQYLTDRTYKPDNKVPEAILKRFEEAGIQRGYNEFVNKFAQILSVIFDIKQWRIKGEPDVLPLVLEHYKDAIFTDALPLPNKALFIVEKSNQVTYLDDVTRDALDMIPLMVSIDRDHHDQSTVVKENRTSKCISRLASFYKAYFKANLSSKPGQIRRHIFASRTVFSFRCVISSITGIHKHNRITVPWGVGLTTFRPHLINKMLKYGMDLNSAVGLIMAHIGKYHPLLDRFLKELVSESRDGVIWAILQRNPSLLKGSAQRVGIDGFWADPGNHTIGMPIGLCVAFNADFDGDELNVSVATDNHMADLWYPLAPSFNAMELDIPYKIAKNASICKPVVTSMSAWLDDDE